MCSEAFIKGVFKLTSSRCSKKFAVLFISSSMPGSTYMAACFESNDHQTIKQGGIRYPNYKRMLVDVTVP
jgi:hypothetical protein